MILSSGSSGRFSVQTVNSDRGVLSSLILSETLAQDFQLRYNCTAWNRFGTGTALVTLEEQGMGPHAKLACVKHPFINQYQYQSKVWTHLIAYYYYVPPFRMVVVIRL